MRGTPLGVILQDRVWQITDVDPDPISALSRLIESCRFGFQDSAWVYWLALGRLPEEPHLRVFYDDPVFDGNSHLLQALLGREFSLLAEVRLPALFPSARRNWLIHVPKCGGTSIEHRVRYGSFRTVAWNPAWSAEFGGWTDLNRQEYMAAVIFRLAQGSDLLFSGHVPLVERVRANLIGPVDRVLVTVRDPLDRLVSDLNFVATAMLQDPDEPSREGWRRMLGAVGSDWRLKLEDPEFLVRLCSVEEYAARMENLICRYISGTQAHEEALSMLSLTRATLIPFEAQESALRAIGMTPSEIQTVSDDRNQSSRIIGPEETWSAEIRQHLSSVRLDEDWRMLDAYQRRPKGHID